MRDFRDAKAMARTLRAALAAKSIKISIAESLELTARSLGAADWNTLAAAIKAQLKPAASPVNLWAAVAPQSAELRSTLHRAAASAKARGHYFTTIEHLLLALLDDADARPAMEGAAVDVAELRSRLTGYVDNDLKELADLQGLQKNLPERLRGSFDYLAGAGDADPASTAGLQRILVRVQREAGRAGLSEVSGAPVLQAILSEWASHAAAFLRACGLNEKAAAKLIPGMQANAAGEPA